MNSKKEKIFDAALKLFSEKGYENTSVTEIIEEAGVSKGLVYHHFKNKGELLREIFQLATDRMIEMSIKSEKISITDLINSIFDQLIKDKTYFKFNLNIMFQPSTKEILSDLIKQRSKLLFNSTLKLFNHISPENAELHTVVFIAEIDGIALDYLAVFDSYPIEKLRSYLIEKYRINP